MGAFDRLRSKAEDLAKKAKPKVEELRERATPLAQTLKEKAEHAGESLKAKAEEVAEGLREGTRDATPSEPKPPSKSGQAENVTSEDTGAQAAEPGRQASTGKPEAVRAEFEEKPEQ